jgi:hypothetical protein
MNESPAFQKMKSEGKTSKAPLSESFGQWKNLKIVLLALFGLVAGQAVVWYSGQFYALFFLTSVLKVDGATANILVAASLIIGTPFFVIFGTLSDKIGRKPIILAGMALAVVTYFPLFGALTKAANPDLAAAQVKNQIVVTAAAGDCSFQGNPVAREIDFTKSCDIAKRFLAQNSVSYDNAVALLKARPAGAWKVLEYGTQAHPLVAGLTKKQRRVGVLFGQLTGEEVSIGTFIGGRRGSREVNGVKRRRSSLALKLPDGNFRFGVRHRGARAKKTWSRGIEASTEGAMRTYRAAHTRALVEIFGR